MRLRGAMLMNNLLANIKGKVEHERGSEEAKHVGSGVKDRMGKYHTHKKISLFQLLSNEPVKRGGWEGSWGNRTTATFYAFQPSHLFLCI